MASLRLAAGKVEDMPEQSAERRPEDVKDPQPRGIRHRDSPRRLRTSVP